MHADIFLRSVTCSLFSSSPSAHLIDIFVLVPYRPPNNWNILNKIKDTFNQLHNSISIYRLSFCLNLLIHTEVATDDMLSHEQRNIIRLLHSFYDVWLIPKQILEQIFFFLTWHKITQN